MTLATPRPPTLPLERSHARWRPVRILVLGLVQAALLLLLASVFGGLTVASFGTAVAAVVVIALLNGFVWPRAVRLTAPVVMLMAQLFTFVLNASLIWLTRELVDGFEVSSFWVALFVGVRNGVGHRRRGDAACR